MKVRILIIAFALCMIATPAMADMYGTVDDVVWNNLIRGYSSLDIVSPYGSTSYPEQYVGLHSLTLGAFDNTGAPNTLPSNSYLVEGSVQAFCIDLQDLFPYEETLYNAYSLDAVPDVSSGGPMLSTKASYIAGLLNTYSYDNDLKAAAMQVAIWEIIYEGATGASAWEVSDTTGSGNFYLDTVVGNVDEIAVANLANTWLDNVLMASSYSQYTGLGHDVGKSTQDFVLVPVPAAVILGILGLGVAGIKLRKYA